jgi:hypothetical protein
MGETSEPIELERNQLSCADRAFANYPRKTTAVSCVCATVSRDANRSAWFAPAVCAFAIVTRARQSQRVICHDGDESTAVASLVVAFCAVSFLKLKLRIAALDFKSSG